MIDASLRMSIVNLFKAAARRSGVSIIYITHDLATAYYISDRLIIMQKGKVVESGEARAVLDDPQHPYSILRRPCCRRRRWQVLVDARSVPLQPRAAISSQHA